VKTILFADDEPYTTYALRLLVEAKGFRCESVTNVTTAMEYLRNHKVSVLVSDIMMPSGDAFSEIDSSEAGLYLVAKVRNEFPDIAVICLSVIADQAKILTLKKQGVLYLRKGETPLDTAAHLIESKATGTYSV
jgi:CheY-like chemotaxis protein